jgi:hypothetical protein
MIRVDEEKVHIVAAQVLACEFQRLGLMRIGSDKVEFLFWQADAAKQRNSEIGGAASEIAPRQIDSHYGGFRMCDSRPEQKGSPKGRAYFYDVPGLRRGYHS